MNLVTGGAGFIGSHLVEQLLASGEQVVVLDNFNEFYDPIWKWQNISEIKKTMSVQGIPEVNLTIIEGDIRDQVALARAFEFPITRVVHLAAMAGVQPSLVAPLLYTDVNITGTVKLLEMCRKDGVRQFVFASSSSVYGNSCRTLFAETEPVDLPVSPYAATKKAGELLCYTYHTLHDLNIACLRFFTVYGPRQRPDLAIFKFTKLITEQKTLPFQGDGSTERDYTYIDDIVAGVIKSMEWVKRGCEPKYEIFNLGNSRAITLRQMVSTLETELGQEARLKRMPVPPGDVLRTCADISKAQAMLGYWPITTFEDGIKLFVDWYRERRG